LAEVKTAMNLCLSGISILKYLNHAITRFQKGMELSCL
jgi:hypothetical protein